MSATGVGYEKEGVVVGITRGDMGVTVELETDEVTARTGLKVLLNGQLLKVHVVPLREAE